jgi:hypothetical protein
MNKEALPQIPLEFASIGWAPKRDEFPFDHPRVIVVDSRTTLIPDAFSMTSGAVFAWWSNPRTPTYKRLLELLWLRGQMCADGVPITDIDHVMDSIPEAVQWLNESIDAGNSVMYQP